MAKMPQIRDRWKAKWVWPSISSHNQNNGAITSTKEQGLDYVG